MKPTIVGFTGKMGTGKSTAVEHLLKRYEGIGPGRAVAVRFAGPLYAACKAWYAALGMPFTKETARMLLQFGGTEWGRGQHGNDFWVNKWKEAVRTEQLYNRHVLVEDVRFDNEAEAIRAMGGTVIEIYAKTDKRDVARNGVAGHSSEAGVNSGLVDMRISNNSGKAQFLKKLDTIVDEILNEG